MAACEAGPDPGAARPASCDVATTVAHANPEEAVSYQGEATWRWKDRTRRVSFQTRCTTAVGGPPACDAPVSTWHD
jgi:hypothetical protein